MAVEYDDSFEECIQRPWLAVSKMRQIDADQPKRQGQLSPDAPNEWALHDTFHYQRGHADVFRDAYRVSRHHPPKKGERLRVVDVGAGAATVAVALGEALGRDKRRRIDYVAFDPNPSMRSLGEQVLEHLDAGFGSGMYIESLEETDFHKGDRLLFSFSYVSHQQAVTLADVDRWASLIKRGIQEVGRAVELMYTTASNIHSIEPKLPMLGEKLDQAGLRRTVEPLSVHLKQRYPETGGRDGRVRWRWRNPQWQVQAERWTLRA
ncbi:hypothetical protein [Candidatus Poriferisodalis sp.]|uniref:hypothetical protein n=1 Tax=Candidatus Poriferisodalis sp. TaxID=3101277 RepID=UPI003B5A1F96